MLGKRIKRARQALGLSLRELADMLDLSHAAIKKYEDEKATPSSTVLLKLSKALNVRVEYFFRPDFFTLENVQFRLHPAHPKMPESRLEEIKSQILDHVERRDELENLFPNPPIRKFEIQHFEPIKNEEEIENIADLIRSKWDLGLDSIPDLINSFEERGIKLFEIDNERFLSFDGLAAFVNGFPIIVYGKKWSHSRQRFTIAHELGHIILSNKLSKNLIEEKCCNRFAGAFLLPKKTIISRIGEHRNNIEIRELALLKLEFGISMSGILHRMEDLNIISNKLYRQLRSELEKKGWLKKEPIEYNKEKSYIFDHMIYHALSEGYIGESKAAEFMDLSIDEFRNIPLFF